MHRDLFHSGLRIAVALLVLAFSLVSRVPTSQCRCHDPKPEKKAACPFGQLRQVSASLMLIPPVAIESVPELLTYIAPLPPPPGFRPLWSQSPSAARGPPRPLA